MGSREIRGKRIAERTGHVLRTDKTHYRVRSQSRDMYHDVVSSESGWSCSCEDHRHTKSHCKHIHAVEASLKPAGRARRDVTIREMDANRCPHCGSANCIKWALRRNKNHDVQVYRCKICSRHFSTNLGFKKMKADPYIITSAIQLYFTGESLRNVQRFLELQGVRVTHKTVWNWIGKYVGLVDEYAESMTPQVSEKWRTDEMYLKIGGNRRYLYTMMDDKTRYWIARQVSDGKYTEDVRPMFRRAARSAGKRPATLISDGAPNFHEAWKREWRARNFLHKDTRHIRHIHMRNDRNNNRMERLNGEIRDREKVMRSLKTDGSPIIPGMQVYHNFIRGHMGIGGRTPSEMAGIRIEGSNRWVTLIQNAIVSRTRVDGKARVRPGGSAPAG